MNVLLQDILQKLAPPVKAWKNVLRGAPTAEDCQNGTRHPRTISNLRQSVATIKQKLHAGAEHKSRWLMSKSACVPGQGAGEMWTRKMRGHQQELIKAHPVIS